MEICKDDIYEMISGILEIDADLVKDIGEDEDFSNVGMTSISFIQLVVILEEKYNFEFKDDDLLFNEFNTFSKLFRLLDTY